MENPNQVKFPQDFAGYQHIVSGLIQDGDLLVYGPSRERAWACLSGSVGFPVISSEYPDMDVYRQIPCPKHEAELKRPWINTNTNKATWPKDTDPNKAKTDDSGKPPLAMLPWKALREVAMVQEYGHQKYHDYFNYKKGLEVGRNLSCAIRHIADYMDGIDLDKESGRNHLAHAACRLLFALENLQDGTAKDNRYKKP